MTAVMARHTGVVALFSCVATIGAAITAGLVVLKSSEVRIALASSAGVILAYVVIRLPVSAVMPAVVTWFVILDTTRRLISGISDKEAWGEPLLLWRRGIPGAAAGLWGTTSSSASSSCSNEHG